MPKKRMSKKSKPRKSTRKDESNFEKWMEERFGAFGKDLEEIGRKIEKKTDKWECCNGGGIGVLGPLFGSIFGLILLSFGIWIVNGFNATFGSSFVSSVTGFLYRNLSWIFLIFIFSGYRDYLSRRFSRTYWSVSPIFSGITAVIVFWLLSWALSLTSSYTGTVFLSTLSSLIIQNLWTIFWFVVVLGYIIAVAGIWDCRKK